MYAEEDYLQISGIQHFVFCRRQWALIHIEQQWKDNLLTAEGEVEHRRVHDENVRDSRNGVITMRGLKVFSKFLGVSGECDAVEFLPSEDGISLNGREGLWNVMPVEYKHGASKFDDCDRLQVTLQAMCLEEMFSIEINDACIFYFKTRRRERIKITDELRNRAVSFINEMHLYMSRGYTPRVKPGKYCKSCSLKEICLPELLKKSESASKYIERFLKERSNEENA